MEQDVYVPTVAHQGGASIASQRIPASPASTKEACTCRIGVVFGGEPRPIARIRAARAQSWLVDILCSRVMATDLKRGDSAHRTRRYRRSLTPWRPQLSLSFAHPAMWLDPPSPVINH